MPKPTIGTAADIAEKWGRVTPGRSADYEAGAVGSGGKWLSNLISAKMAYKAGITASDIDARYIGGAKRAGAAKYDRKVRDIGVSRFGPGVAAAVGDFQTGFDPYIPVIASVDMPARKPRGDPGNLARVSAITTALHKKRLAMIGAGASK